MYTPLKEAEISRVSVWFKGIPSYGAAKSIKTLSVSNLARYIYRFYELKGCPSLKKLNVSWLNWVHIYFIWSQGNSFTQRSWMYCDLTRYTDIYFMILRGFLHSKRLSVWRLSCVHLYVIWSQGNSFTQRSWMHTDIYFMILKGFLHLRKLSVLRLSWVHLYLEPTHFIFSNS